MMTQGNHSLHVAGSKLTTDVHIDSNLTSAIQQLKHELMSCQGENRKLVDQLNCLVTLIRRSWNGDRNATVHLSNIVGKDPPSQNYSQDGSIARPNSQMNPPLPKTRCERNWERLAMKLLDREYQTVQEEIREYQQRYIQNRQAYMDAVLQDHQQSMSRIPLHRNNDNWHLMEDVDSKFIKHNKALERMGIGNRGRGRRAQSAGYKRRVPVPEAVERMEVSLRELVGDTPSSDHFLTGQKLNEHHTITPLANGRGRPQSSTCPQRSILNTYNDPNRYAQNNLFALNERDGVKRQRPVSASSLKEGDAIRSRPRSGRPIVRFEENQADKPVFITQKNERPLKYETTRPVSSKPKLNKRRDSTGSAKKSASETRVHIQPQTDVICATNMASASATCFGENNFNSVTNKEDTYHNNNDLGDNYHEQYERGQDFEGPESERMMTKPPMAVRVKSGFTRRPAFIDEFAQDERAMKNMEDDFKKTALDLQKRLGIRDSGIVTLDD